MLMSLRRKFNSILLLWLSLKKGFVNVCLSFSCSLSSLFFSGLSSFKRDCLDAESVFCLRVGESVFRLLCLKGELIDFSGDC
jgi:hypothetical protein